MVKYYGNIRPPKGIFPIHLCFLLCFSRFNLPQTIHETGIQITCMEWLIFMG